jgi:nitrite reductase/ring-hydroxylating ferredoxin subunit
MDIRAAIEIFIESDKKILPLRKVNNSLPNRILVKFSSGLVLLDNICPHNGLSLHNAHVEGDIVVCKWHGCRFGIEGAAVPDANILPTAFVEISDIIEICDNEITKRSPE